VSCLSKKKKLTKKKGRGDTTTEKKNQKQKNVGRLHRRISKRKRGTHYNRTRLAGKKHDRRILKVKKRGPVVNDNQGDRDEVKRSVSNI